MLGLDGWKTGSSSIIFSTRAENIDVLNYELLVEIQGFKPWTSAMPWQRSNQLSYIPLCIKLA
jgi:hypothetical protein